MMKLGITLTALCAFSISCSHIPPTELTRSAFFVKRAGGTKVIILLHGIFGDINSTWRNPNGAYWPDMMAQDKNLSDYDIYVVNYRSPYFGRASTISEVATRELQNLKDQEFFKTYKQIFIVAHSMGGLIAKRMLARLNRPDEVKYLHMVKMTIFLSTPAQGSSLAAIASIFSSNPQLTGMDISEKNEYIVGLEEDWRDLIRTRNRTGQHFPKAFCAYETLPTFGVLLVGRREADTYCDNDFYPIDRNHIDMVKPADPDDSPYPWVKKRILETAVFEDDLNGKISVNTELSSPASPNKLPSVSFESERERIIAIEAVRKDSLERIIDYGETPRSANVKGKVWTVGDQLKFERDLWITPEFEGPSILRSRFNKFMPQCSIPAGESLSLLGFYKEEGTDFVVLRYGTDNMLDYLTNRDKNIKSWPSCGDYVTFLHELQLLP